MDISRDVPLRTVLLMLVTAAALIPNAAWAQTSSSGSGDKPWYERITFGGDLRLRYESFYQKERESRQRLRFRLRLGVRGPITDQIDFGVRLASGDLGDITSTNQSSDGFFSRKQIGIDQAFLAWRPAAPVTLGGGKFGYPVTRTQLVWDDDVNWEGVFEQVTISRGVSARISAAQTVVDESSGGDDTAMFALQGLVTIPSGKHRLEVSLANYAYRNVDAIALAFASGALVGQNTNRLRFDDGGNVVGYLSGYNMVDLIAAATLDTGRAGYPITVLVDWVTNLDAATDEDTGVWFDASYGRASSPRTYKVGYVFARAERECTLSAFNFSDLPGTNYQAHLISGSYQPVRRVNIDFIGFFSKRIDVAPGAPNYVLKRYQLDVRVSF